MLSIDYAHALEVHLKLSYIAFSLFPKNVIEIKIYKHSSEESFRQVVPLAVVR